MYDICEGMKACSMAVLASASYWFDILCAVCDACEATVDTCFASEVLLCVLCGGRQHLVFQLRDDMLRFALLCRHALCFAVLCYSWLC